jgi:asparagine synthase (glutamine-hydrolysing)
MCTPDRTCWIVYNGEIYNYIELREELKALGHRRLSIVDLSPAGHQPMCTADRRYWIVYNGEVYNHNELRKELEKAGNKFVGHSDTEVILASYAQWGKDCLSRFNGMFAFIIFDAKERKLFAARDRFGVKPLYYWRSPDGLLAFASEIKQFTVLPGWDARMNGQRVYDFLNWGLMDHTRETLFRDVYQLQGGEALEVRLAENRPDLPVYRWYHLKPGGFHGTQDKAAAEFHRLLKDSVRLRLQADVPVGSCLSGGLDSSSIVCLVNDILHDSGDEKFQKTFSATSSIRMYDESRFIAEVVNTRKIEAHYIHPELDNLFTTLEELAWHQDEPFGSTSIYAQWNVFKLAADNQMKVMLDGQGADEQLAGYHSYYAPLFVDLFRRLRWLTLIREVRAIKRLHGYSEKIAIKMIVGSIMPDWLRQRLKKDVRDDSAMPDWIDMERLGAKPVDPHKATGLIQSSVYDLSYNQLLYTSLPMLLHWEDRDSMAHSIESRVPFLDYRLVEFVLGLPDEYKITRGVTKNVLREGMKDVLPEAIRLRMDKMGFVTPEAVWVCQQSSDLFRKYVKDSIDVSGGIIRPEAGDRLERIIAGEETFTFFAWRVISFGSWVKKFGVKP